MNPNRSAAALQGWTDQRQVNVQLKTTPAHQCKASASTWHAAAQPALSLSRTGRRLAQGPFVHPQFSGSLIACLTVAQTLKPQHQQRCRHWMVAWCEAARGCLAASRISLGGRRLRLRHQRRLGLGLQGDVGWGCTVHHEHGRATSSAHGTWHCPHYSLPSSSPCTPGPSPPNWALLR